MVYKLLVTDEQRNNLLKWCKVLKSGKYLQGNLCLAKGPQFGGLYSHYCCLGVAQQIFENITEPEIWFPDEHIKEKYGFNSSIDEELIPLNNKKVDYAFQDLLVHWNDTMKFTFTQIADNVEALLEGKELPHSYK